MSLDLHVVDMVILLGFFCFKMSSVLWHCYSTGVLDSSEPSSEEGVYR